MVTPAVYRSSDKRSEHRPNHRKETENEDDDLQPTRGPCNLEHQGETADDVIKAQDRHLKEAEKAGDASHQEARDAMKSRWRHPKKSMDWYRDMKTAFAELPED